MNREEVLKKLRELYKEKDFKSLKRNFLMHSYALTEEDKEKIKKVLYPGIVIQAAKILGGKIL